MTLYTRRQPLHKLSWPARYAEPLPLVAAKPTTVPVVAPPIGIPLENLKRWYTEPCQYKRWWLERFPLDVLGEMGAGIAWLS